MDISLNTLENVEEVKIKSGTCCISFNDFCFSY